MSQGDPGAAEENPEYVHDCGECAGGFFRAADDLAKRDQGEQRELDALDAEWDSNNRQAEGQASQEIFKEEYDSASEDDP